MGAVIGGLFGLIGVVAFLYCFCVHFLHWPSRRHHRNKFKQQGLLASDNSGTMSTPDRHKSRQ